MIDVLEYTDTIKRILSQMRVRREQREDAQQECYLALLEKQDFLERAVDSQKYAALICRNRLTDLYRKESQQQPGHKSEINARLLSMTDPKISNWVNKIAEGSEAVTDEQLEEAIQSLPYAEYEIIYGIFVEGKSQEQMAEDLKTTRWSVRTRMESGIEELKRYFEVE